MPIFTDVEAAELCYKFGEIVSVDGREGPLDSFLVLFASGKGNTAGPLVLSTAVARKLCDLLIAAGHGPPTAPS